MIRLLKNDPRPAVGFLNYNNPIVPNPMIPMGPTTIGEQVWPVEISEDGLRVGFSYISPEEDNE